MFLERWPDNDTARFCCLLLRRYLRHSVGIRGAALAFYLLFSIFPFLIFISALLGLLRLDGAEILAEVAELLPQIAEPEAPESRIVGIFRPSGNMERVKNQERDDEYETERDEYLNHSLDILEQNRRKKAI